MSDNAASENIISLQKPILMQYSGMKYYLYWTDFVHHWTWVWTIVFNFERKLYVIYSIFEDPNEKVNDDDKFMTQESINAERQ